MELAAPKIHEPHSILAPDLDDVTSAIVLIADSLSIASQAMADAALATAKALQLFADFNASNSNMRFINERERGLNHELVGTPLHPEGSNFEASIDNDSSSSGDIYEDDHISRLESSSVVSASEGPTGRFVESQRPADAVQPKLNPNPANHDGVAPEPFGVNVEKTLNRENKQPSTVDPTNSINDTITNPSSLPKEKSSEAKGAALPDSTLASNSESKQDTETATPSEPASRILQTIAESPKLPWGRHYIQLAEEFDAIPIISCMALANRKTICLVPSSLSLSPYKKLLNAVTKLEIIVPLDSNTPSQIKQSLQRLIVLPSQAILLLSFDAMNHVSFSDASPDCVVHWGWPVDRSAYINQITRLKLHTRSCLLLPSGEHLKPMMDAQASSYGVVKYPDMVMSSYFGPGAPSQDMWGLTVKVFSDTDTETMAELYHSWFEYYGRGPTRRSDWTVLKLMNYARQYAAKVLLRGPISDGSQLYPPTSTRQLPIPDWVVKAFEPVEFIPASSRSEADSTPKPTKHTRASSSNQSKPSALDAFGSSFSGRYYVVLDEDFDIIPLISLLALRNNRTVCCLPSPESLLSYRKIFEAIADIVVFHPQAVSDAEYAHSQLAISTKKTLLLQPFLALQQSPLDTAIADTFVCWGFPTNFDTDYSANTRAVSQSCLLLSTEEYADPSIRGALARFAMNKHPSNALVNNHEENSLLSELRHKTRQLFVTNFSPTAQNLYYCFVSFYSAGRGKPVGLTPEDIARAANRYAARSLLRGNTIDGSKRYPPVAGRPTLSPGVIRAHNLSHAKEVGLLN